jgi:hypothetical protein
MRGHFLSMDKGTVRGMIGAKVFNVALPTRSGRQIAEFSPAGWAEACELDRVREACDPRFPAPASSALPANPMVVSFGLGSGGA